MTDIVIVAAARTAVGKFGGALAKTPASELGAVVIKDLLRRFLSEGHDLANLSDLVAIQLNDTHPAIAGPELVRILHDERGLSFEDAVETPLVTGNASINQR